MQHTFISRELLLCQSGIGAAPIDKYPTAPGTASRYCTLFLGVVALVVACSPCSRSKSNLTPAAYHLAVQTVRMGYTLSILLLRRAVLQGSAATSREADRIGSRRSFAQPRPGTAESLPGPVVNKCRGNDPVDLQRGKE